VLHHIYATSYLARTGDLAGLRPGLATPTSAPRCGSPTSPPTSSTKRGERAFARTPIALEFDRDPP
jgi:hypothetical protein